jgi:hypothetical protein
VPMGVLGAFGILGGLSVLLLPETGDRPMVATLQEGEQLPRYRHICARLPPATVCTLSSTSTEAIILTPSPSKRPVFSFRETKHLSRENREQQFVPSVALCIKVKSKIKLSS